MERATDESGFPLDGKCHHTWEYVSGIVLDCLPPIRPIACPKCGLRGTECGGEIRWNKEIESNKSKGAE